MTKKERYFSFLRGETKDIIGISEFKEFLLDTSQDKKIENEAISILENRYPGEGKKRYDGLQAAILTSFFTPSQCVTLVVEAIPPEKIKSILEPSAGKGDFVEILQQKYPNASITAVEKEIQTFEILKENYPTINAIHSPIEKLNFKGQYDLAISNIPFGDFQVFDSFFVDEKTTKEIKAAKIKSTTKIHNYFFAKGLDQIKDGGYIAYQVSTSFADTKSNEFIREYMVQKANLRGIVRLPNTIFENTEVATDIIILQKNNWKKTLSKREEEFIKSTTIQIQKDPSSPPLEFAINSLVKQEQNQIVQGEFGINNMHGRESLTVNPIAGIDVYQKAKESLANQIALTDSVSLQAETEIEKPTFQFDQNQIPIPENSPILSYKTIGVGNLGYQVQDQKLHIGVIRQKENQFYLEAETLPYKVAYPLERVQAIVGLLDTYNQLNIADKEALSSGNPSNAIQLRRELNRIYDTYFGFQFGLLSDPVNLLFIEIDKDSSKILSLENRENGKVVKSDIFKENLQKEVELTKVLTLQDSINQSLNKFGYIDENHINSTHSVEEAIKEGSLFFDPLTEKIVTKDEFQSGPIADKLASLEEKKNQLSYLTDADVFQNHQNLLYEVKPLPVQIEDIGLNLGENWIGAEIFSEFATEILKTKINVSYMESNDTYHAKQKNTWQNTAQINEVFAVSTLGGRGDKFDGVQIFEMALNDRVPTLTYKIDLPDGTEGTKVDTEGMEKLSLMVSTLQKEFENWIIQHEQYSKQIQDTWYQKTTQYVDRAYSGQHLTFDDLQVYSPRPHQKDANWQLLVNNGGIIDHAVGAGKTLVIINHAHELKRLGLAKKPMIVAMKANVHEIYKTYKEAYPRAKVLYPTEEDFKEKNLKTLLFKIASNDWEAVIISHNQLQKIPKPSEIVIETINDELSKLEKDLDAALDGNSPTKSLIKGLQKRKENLMAKLDERLHQLEKEKISGVPDLKELGIDHLIVDESQVFKNLPFTTRQTRVSGLGNPIGSNIAYDMLMACRTIQATVLERTGDYDKGVTFLSGTPISNSLIELPLLFKYLVPEKMNDMGLVSMDAWLKTYARKTTEYEINVDGQLKSKERYRQFIKVPELAQFYKSMAHVITKDDVRQFVKIPKLETELINIDPTESQKAFGEELVKLAKNGSNPSIGIYPSKENKSAAMLLVTNLGRKSSIDMRLIDSNQYANEGTEKTKLFAVAEQIHKYYQESNSFKGTQSVFSDIGTPGTGKEFNVYDELKSILVSHYKIPAREIQFIHDHQTPTKKPLLFKSVNRGEVRVIIGSTQMLGTGVNIQKLMIATHHIDIPWRPSDTEQRDGRSERQGNINPVVFKKVYATNRTINSYQFQLNQDKSFFIMQLRKGSISTRTLDEGAIDSDGAINWTEFVALTQGDTKLLEKAKASKEFETYQRYLDNYKRDQSKSTFEINSFTRRIESSREQLTKLSEDLKSLQKTVKYEIDPKNPEEKKLVINLTNRNKEPFATSQEAGTELIIAYSQIRKSPESKLHHCANYGDFQIGYIPNRNSATPTAQLAIITPSGEIIKSENLGIAEKPGSVARQPIDLLLRKIPSLVEDLKYDIQRFESRIEGLQIKQGESFKYQDEYNQSKMRLEKIDKEIADRAKESEKELLKPETEESKKSEIDKTDTVNEKKPHYQTRIDSEIRQYENIQSKYPDQVVIIASTDNYKVFGPKAIPTSQILGTVLTFKEDSSKQRMPMTSFNREAFDVNIKKLTRAGLKIAVADPLLTKEKEVNLKPQNQNNNSFNI